MRFISIDGGGCDDGLKFSTRGGVRRSRLVSKRRLDAYNGQKKEGGGLKFIYVQEIARVANAGVMRSPAQTTDAASILSLSARTSLRHRDRSIGRLMSLMLCGDRRSLPLFLPPKVSPLTIFDIYSRRQRGSSDGPRTVSSLGSDQIAAVTTSTSACSTRFNAVGGCARGVALEYLKVRVV